MEVLLGAWVVSSTDPRVAQEIATAATTAKAAKMEIQTVEQAALTRFAVGGDGFLWLLLLYVYIPYASKAY